VTIGTEVVARSNRNRAARRVSFIAAVFVGLSATGPAPARAQAPNLTLASPTPIANLAKIVGEPETLAQPAFDGPEFEPSIEAVEGVRSTTPLIESTIFSTMAESLFGNVYAEGRWQPLSLSTFFSEGWHEPWVSAPAGQNGLTPRHGWLGAFNGLFFRLWSTTFSDSNDLNAPYRGNRYSGLYDIFLPFSRRFEILLDVPFVVSNGTKASGRGYTTEFGDLSITPRFMLSESVATTQVFAVQVGAPTGTKATGNGTMSLQPRYEFWTNPTGPWVVRGGSGMDVPLNSSHGPSGTAYTGDLAIGRYFTPHDAPFGDLVFYVASNWKVPLDGTSKTATNFGIGPGTRFHITRNFFFLHYWEFPLVGPHLNNFTVQFALVKVF
jgi:hypothetical protein